MSDLQSLADRLRPFEVVDNAYTTKEFADAWRMSEEQAGRHLRELVASGKLRKVKTRREYEHGSKIVPAYVEVVGAV